MDGIIDNLTSAINTWNSKLAEIWLLLTESPESFKGGDIWKIIVKVHEGLQCTVISNVLSIQNNSMNSTAISAMMLKTLVRIVFIFLYHYR